MEISYIYDGRGTNIAERLEKCDSGKMLVIDNHEMK
jgi:hypothetical protein